MANATQTIAGDVQLAGDIGGNNNAASPALVDTGVVSGAYAVASLTVDSKGRLTLAGNSTAGQVMAIVPNATTTSKGAVQIGSGLSVTDGLVSLNAPDATYTTKGVVQVDPTTLVISAGVLSLPVASASQRGGVKIGAGLSIDGSGVLSTSALPFATTSTTGVVKIGTGLSIDGTGNLTLNAPIATTSTTGVVKIGSGLNIDGTGNLTLNAPIATTSTTGVVKIGTGLSINGTGNLTLNASVAYLDQTNTYTKAQRYTPVALTYGANISVNAALSNIFTVTLTGNGTLDNPTNLAAGVYTFVIAQDAVGGRTLSFGTSYKFKYGDSRILSTGSSAVDVVVCVSNGTSLFCSLSKGFV